VTGVFLQVRLDSTRLPRKALLELAGVPVIVHAMAALRRVNAARHVLVTEPGSADEMRELAGRNGFELFVGPKANVLERFALAAEDYGVTTIIRATGDNPVVSWELARLTAREQLLRGADYCALTGPPLGTGVEVFTAEALVTAYRETRDPYDTEHVTPYLYKNSGRFRSLRIEAPPAYRAAEARVTLDTEADYAYLSDLFAALYDGAAIPIRRLVRFCRDHGRGHYAGANQ
jgi:spore coat polysaccharide biosynthesis protein SpsF